MAVHGKTYAGAEKAHRFAAFTKNAQVIEAHNADTTQTFTLGFTKFADLTNAEYRATLNLRRSGKAPTARPLSKAMPLSNAALPASVDWRTKGAVNDVKDQGQCGSCWSFSATTAMETAWFLKNGTLLSLSEQMCVDCVDGGADNCDQGGEMHDCYLQVIKQGGDELESDYPYTATSKGKCKYAPAKAVTTFTGYMNVTMFNETALAVAAVQTVISVAIDASSDKFQMYTHGVYNVPSCKSNYDGLDHGVAVVGYGALNGVNYWLVRNSWGSSWGMEGYILMSKDKNNQCGIATDATWPLT